MRINFPENLKVVKCYSTCSCDPINGEINIFLTNNTASCLRVITNRTGLALFSTFKRLHQSKLITTVCWQNGTTTKFILGWLHYPLVSIASYAVTLILLHGFLLI